MTQLSRQAIASNKGEEPPPRLAPEALPEPHGSSAQMKLVFAAIAVLLAHTAPSVAASNSFGILRGWPTGGRSMTTLRNPQLIITVKCAGPGCTNVRRESNHWFLTTVVDRRFICRPYLPAQPLRPRDQPVCGQACAQKLFERFLACAPG